MKILYVLCICVFFLCTSCQTVTKNGFAEEQEPTEQEKIENEINLLFDAMVVPNSVKIDVICQRLINYGDKALPAIVSNLENRIPIVRLLSIFCLGQMYEKTKNKDILQHKKIVKARLQDPVYRVQLEAASTLVIFQDYSGVPMIIDALNDENKYVRMTAAQILTTYFQETFGYVYYDEEERREVAVQKWRDWWTANKNTLGQKNL